MARETREMSQLHLQQMSTSLQNQVTPTSIGQGREERRKWMQVEQSMDSVAKAISARTAETLKGLVKEELGSLAGQLGSTSIRSSGAGTPAASATNEKAALQRQLALQVQGKDLNGAFQTALNACDLEVLTFLLSKLEPKALFAKSPFPLTNPVLLSLLHQLAAADLRKETELKLRYIDEALGALDESNADVQKFLPKILTDLSARLKEFKVPLPPTPSPFLLLSLPHLAPGCRTPSLRCRPR